MGAVGVAILGISRGVAWIYRTRTIAGGKEALPYSARALSSVRQADCYVHRGAPGTPARLNLQRSSSALLGRIPALPSPSDDRLNLHHGACDAMSRLRGLSRSDWDDEWQYGCVGGGVVECDEGIGSIVGDLVGQG
jgi:hypothetical protein